MQRAAREPRGVPGLLPAIAQSPGREGTTAGLKCTGINNEKTVSLGVVCLIDWDIPPVHILMVAVRGISGCSIVFFTVIV